MIDKETLFLNQKVWTVFLNKPISKKTLEDMLSNIHYKRIEYLEEEDSAGMSAGWHTITFDNIQEINKLRTVLLLDNYRVIVKTTEGTRAYLDVYI